MTAPAYTTRSQAAAPEAYLIEIMAAGAYAAYRTKAPSFPPWDQANEVFRDAWKADMAAAIIAAEAVGYVIARPVP